MKYPLVTINLVLYGFSIVSAVVASNTSNSVEGHDDNLSNVLISMSGHKAVELSLKRNGDLVHQDIPDVDISSALVHEHEHGHASCFFWRQVESLSQYNWPGRFVSRSFSYGKPLTSRFDHAERLYCYDATEEQLSGNIFTLFIESGRGAKKLARVEVPEDESYVELAPDKFGIKLGVRTQVALVASPVKKRYARQDAPYHTSVCNFVLAGEPDEPFRWLVSTRSVATLTLDRRVETVVCFRDIDDTQAIEVWLHSRYGR